MYLRCRGALYIRVCLFLHNTHVSFLSSFFPPIFILDVTLPVCPPCFSLLEKDLKKSVMAGKFEINHYTDIRCVYNAQVIFLMSSTLIRRETITDMCGWWSLSHYHRRFITNEPSALIYKYELDIASSITERREINRSLMRSPDNYIHTI